MSNDATAHVVKAVDISQLGTFQILNFISIRLSFVIHIIWYSFPPPDIAPESVPKVSRTDGKQSMAEKAVNIT